MTGKARSATAVIVGALLWAVLWVGGAAVIRALWPGIIVTGQRLDHTGALLGYIAYSVIVSIVSGFATGRIARGSIRAVYVLAGIQLALGIVIEAMGWRLAPAWYHIVFLVLLVPAIVYGGRLARAT